ncbi:hypothetical protein GCM10009789_39870 [Kribbella sancticallisti]|uniref:Uncharacterized protein n=1 Tax=Kribbella sancticallisti TaxID=460087 RepID=A0ABP4PIH8_9ACTN
MGSSRATIHRALTVAPTAVTEDFVVVSDATVTSYQAAGPQHAACLGCGAVPNGKIAAARLREELQTDWWSTTAANPDRIEVTRHCGRCQPHTVHAIACLTCGDGLLLTGELAELARDTDPQQLPGVVTDRLATSGWQWATTSYGTGWICNRHTTAQPPNPAPAGASR